MEAPGHDLEHSLAESDGQLRSAFEISPDCVLVLDLAGRVRFVNAVAARLLGRVPGAHWSELCAEPDRPVATAALAAAASGERQRIAVSLATSGGAVRRSDNIIAPLYDPVGRPIGLLITARDVTDLEQAAAEAREDKLAQQSSVLRSAAEIAKLAGWDLDFRRNLVRVADEAIAALEAGPQHRIVSLDQALAVYDAEQRARILEQIDHVRLHGGRLSYEARLARENRSVGWVRVLAEPVYEGKICIGLRGAVVDITDEVTGRESLQSARQRLNLAVQLAGMEVYELDFERHTLVQEGSTASIFGAPVRYDDLWPEPLDLVHPQDRAAVQREWREAQARQAPFRAEFRVQRRDGREMWIYAVAIVIREGGRPRRVVSAIMDITQRKRSELEILHTMAQMREHEARQKLLLDELNHRVKNTLAAVQSVAAQSLTDRRDLREGRELFIERLLALSATHDLLVKHAWAGASFLEILEAVLKPYGHVFHHDGPDLHLDANFAVSLGMALHELAVNALKHGAWTSEGQVNVATAVQGAEVQITWSEHGGPPVTPAMRQGFGSRLLQRGVAGELGGTVLLDFPPEGLVCSIRAPVSPRLQPVVAA